MADWKKVLKSAVLKGDEDVADEATRRGLSEGIPPLDLLKSAVEGIYAAGEIWHAGDYYLPDIILATEAFGLAMKNLEPLISEAAGTPGGRVVIGSVAGDAHDIGKKIVIALLGSAGYEVHDMGSDVAAERFVEKVREVSPVILGLGAYMTTTMRNMSEVLDALVEAGVRDGVKVIVGGADGYAADAIEAVKLADRLLGAT
jgi:methanogenic corrinoid protein MtbC1